MAFFTPMSSEKVHDEEEKDKDGRCFMIIKKKSQRNEL